MTVYPIELPLRDAAHQLWESSRARGRFDTMIFQRLQRLQNLLRAQRPTGGDVDVTISSWGSLGWRDLRLVVIGDAEECVDLLSMPSACCEEACLFLPALVGRMGL